MRASEDAEALCDQRLSECPDPAEGDRVQLCEELETLPERKVACGLTTEQP